MGPNERRPDKAPRPVHHLTGVRERYHVADADLRRQRKPKMEAPGGWSDKTFEDSSVRGLEIPRAEGHHCREM